MISTCSHKDYKSNEYKTYAISGNRGKDANYNGPYFYKLAPKLSFWKIWHDNIGKIQDEENNRYYIEEYYNQVLSKLDPEEIYKELDGSILLCYEDSYEFCHRHVVAEWLQILLGVKVPEIKVEGRFIKEFDRPEYIRTYLEEVMRKNKDMKGFVSLRALYVFEKGEKLEEQANIMKSQNINDYINYRKEADYLKSAAEEIDVKYCHDNMDIIKQKIKNR